MDTRFLHTRGKDFVHNGEVVMLRGFGVGSWLNMEPFMIGIPPIEGMIQQRFAKVYGQTNADAFFDLFYESFFSEADAAYLHELGVNFIRVPFNYHLFIDDQNPQVYKSLGFRLLDRLMDICEEHQIFVMLDLHATPGGQNPDWHSGSLDGQSSFWQFKVFRDQMVELWKTLANRYKHYSYLAGYDLLNEPYILNEEEGLLNSFYNDTIQAIRSVDDRHIIFLEGDFFAMDFTELKITDDRQIAISFHYYPSVWYPEFFDPATTEDGRRQLLSAGLDKIINTIQQTECPLLCGEAGYEIRSLGLDKALQITAETIDQFEARGISWCLWSYKDSGIMGLVLPESTSPWMQFVNAISLKWDHHKMTRYSLVQLNQLVDQFPDVMMAGDNGDKHSLCRGQKALESITDGDRNSLAYRLHFRYRTILFKLEDELILDPILRDHSWEEMQNLPESFKLEACTIRQPYADYISSVCRVSQEQGNANDTSINIRG